MLNFNEIKISKQKKILVSKEVFGPQQLQMLIRFQQNKYFEIIKSKRGLKKNSPYDFEIPLYFLHTSFASTPFFEIDLNYSQ